VSRTRRSLHAVAEYLLAGPQFRASGTIRLRACGGGFATVAAPDVRVENGDLVTSTRRVTIDGAAVSSLAEAVGLDGGRPGAVYSDGSAAVESDRFGQR